MRDIKWTDHPAVTSQPTLCFGNSTSMNHGILIINVGGTGIDISRPGITVVISSEVMVGRSSPFTGMIVLEWGPVKLSHC